MNPAAYDAIEQAWEITKLVRSVFPSTPYAEGTFTEYESPSWYKEKEGTGGRISFFNPVPSKMLNETGKFVNESFIIYMMAILEEFGIVPYNTQPDESRKGGEYVKLTKWYRNRFAHGESKFNPSKETHKETRAIFEKLFPELADITTGFPTSIDTVLPKLKDRVLEYIRATT